MRPPLVTLLTGLVLLLTSTSCLAADKWPKTISAINGTVIKIYKPEVLTYTDTTIQSRFVLSITSSDDDDPVFGMAWTTARITMDSTARLSRIGSVHVDHLQLRDDTSQVDVRYLSLLIEFRMPGIISYPRDLTSFAEPDEVGYTDTAKKVPVIYYRTRPTALVLIDGTPRLQKNRQWGLDAVVNSPFVIVKDKDEKFYLYGGGHWYFAPAATGPYTFTHDRVSRPLRKIARGFKKAARKDQPGLQDAEKTPVVDILVSTTPAVLLQSAGDPQPKTIPGTALVYMNNSQDNIFFDTTTHVYYVETGEKWYQSEALRDSSQWQPVQPSQLPPDFALIPAQSPKGDVLSNVPGTAAAADRQRLASVPQVQKVDRNVTTTFEYDGTPTFSPIEGTRLAYATNTCAIVLLENGYYYTLDNGVWFVGTTPFGSWHVSTMRPLDVELIPRRHLAYRARFVYVYRRTPAFVWDGYLPGYLDDPGGGCGLAAMDDYDMMDDAWCFDLDFIFGWGGGWYGSGQGPHPRLSRPLIIHKEKDGLATSHPSSGRLSTYRSISGGRPGGAGRFSGGGSRGYSGSRGGFTGGGSRGGFSSGARSGSGHSGGGGFSGGHSSGGGGGHAGGGGGHSGGGGGHSGGGGGGGGHH